MAGEGKEEPGWNIIPDVPAKAQEYGVSLGTIKAYRNVPSPALPLLLSTLENKQGKGLIPNQPKPSNLFSSAKTPSGSYQNSPHLLHHHLDSTPL